MKGSREYSVPGPNMDSLWTFTPLAALVLVEAPVRGPPPPPSDRELELDALALDNQDQCLLLALESALHPERNSEPLVFSQAICLFVFIVFVYYFII